MKTKKSWQEKLQSSKTYEVKPVHINIAGMKRGQIMLVPSPKIIDEFIRKIPAGKSMDIKTLRQKLAKKFHAEVTCPITTGFHLRTVAEAAYEAYNAGVKLKDITPFWRVLDKDTPISKRLTCDIEFIQQQRQLEAIA